MSPFKYTVVGSGTAGWLTALYLQHYYPFARIEVIASSDIGILGAGEGTTPNVLAALKKLNIPLEGLVKHASATIKNGIKFTNWNGDDTSYFHGFANQSSFNPFKFNNETGNALPILPLEQILEGNNLDSILIDAHLAETNRVKYLANQSLHNKMENAFSHFDQMGSDSIHFNAAKLAEYLKTVAIERGVRHIDQEVTGFEQDSEGYITGVVTKDKTYTTSFLFDCSGFHRLVIGKLYQSEWVSYKEYLPMKKAIGFFMPQGDYDELPSYTEAIAMNNGWAWKIPVQDRFGCGYAFDTDYITEEQAKEEVVSKFGADVTFGKTFNFEPGHYKTPWVKNCIAIGLSSGFIEPLEATSIMIQVIGLDSYLDNNLGVIKKDPFYINRYNERMSAVNSENMEFIYAHYLGKREDTAFWKEFKEKNKTPERVVELLEECKYTMPDEMFFTSRRKQVLYSIPSWYSVMAGIKLFDPIIAREVIDAATSDFRREELLMHRTKFKVNLLLNKDTFMKHRFFLDYLTAIG
jgi:tryptophan halogenase